jgi:Kae1-associated kinase Bud32
MKIIKRGAEAVLYLENENLVKDRIKKSYRISEIDEVLRKDRTKKEAKLINEARRIGIQTPKILEIKENKIVMEFIEGERLKEFFNNSNKREEVAEKLGRNVGLLHSNGIVHGDLTTSNMILRNNEIVFIDFGLGSFSKRIEDFATDLSVLKEAIKSTHFKHLEEIWNNFIKGYKETNPNWDKVLKALNNIEKRGRYIQRGLE